MDCVIIDNEPAKAYVAANEGLKVLETPYTEENYAIAVSKDNEALLNAVNEALDALIADGTVRPLLTSILPHKEKNDTGRGEGFLCSALVIYRRSEVLCLYGLRV